MNSRRRILLSLVALGLQPFLGVPSARAATRRATPSARPSESTAVYTRDVRSLTSRLTIPKGRWKTIVLHHSGTPHGNASTYDREHRQRGMENGLAYHFVIGNGVDSRDGQIEIGSRWIRQIKGGHVHSESMNETAIGICLVGNYQESRPTAKQLAALKELVTYLRDNRVAGRHVRFLVHREANPRHTECPGRFFPTEQMHRLFR